MSVLSGCRLCMLLIKKLSQYDHLCLTAVKIERKAQNLWPITYKYKNKEPEEITAILYKNRCSTTIYKLIKNQRDEEELTAR